MSINGKRRFGPLPRLEYMVWVKGTSLKKGLGHLTEHFPQGTEVTHPQKHDALHH